MTEPVESPERIWIESGGECPYFYHEEELSDVDSPVTEYVRADKLRSEIEALLDALHQIAEWPDGGNRYGQGNIKRFAQAAIDAAMRKEDSND